MGIIEFKRGGRHSNRTLKKHLVETHGVEYRCAICGLDSWQGKEITLELDHIDGDNSNNEKDNLRFLCPNCHSQTDTFCGRNNTGVKKVSDEELIQAIENTETVSEALCLVNLRTTSGNYARAYKLLAEKLKTDK